MMLVVRRKEFPIEPGVVDPGLFALMLAASVVIYLTPGPDMLYVLAHTISQGTRAGLLASLGMGLGMVLHTTAATVGLASVLVEAPTAYDVIRYVGGAYLAYLGLRTWVESRRAVLALPGSVPDRAVVVRAVVTNLLNPKIVMFYLAFLPQFVDPGRGHTAVQFLVLGGTLVVLGLVADCAVAMLAGPIRSRLVGSPEAQVIVHRIAAVVFLGLAVKLVAF